MKMLSHIASIARGSVAGNSYSANQFAQIIVRARTAPVQPCTTWQTKSKAAFTAANTAWHALSPANRQGWIDYADSLVYSGPLGTYKVPGRQVFLSNYGTARYLFDRGILTTDPIITPPTNLGFIGIEDLNIEAPPSEGTGYKITGTNPNPEDIGIVIFNSRAFDTSRLRYKGPFLSDPIFGGVVLTTAAISLNVTGLNADSKYFCSVRAVVDDGEIRISPLFYLNTVAATFP